MWRIIALNLLLAFAVEMGAATLIRGPYLQNATSNTLMVRWRTDAQTESRVRYNGGTPIDQVADDSLVTTNHIITLSNLLADTTYFYEIGSPTQTLASGSTFFFRTPPPMGSTRPIRIWVLGDSGFTTQYADVVRNAYYNFSTNHYTDVWLMLGDNAYQDGTDAQYQGAVFNMYPTMLRQTPLWSTIGNRDTAGSTSPSLTIPYFEIFSFPTNGEAGGVASGSEKYYSFDYGNIHFVCLDSMTSDRSTNGPMAKWLREDLAANSQEWLIAFWHHPAYSKGSYNSDTQPEANEMRSNIVPILESFGVDLAFWGHSHCYERSFLLDGHYGISTTLTTNNLKNGGSGRLDGSGAYFKPTLGLAAHEGAVYSTAGSGAQTNGGTLNHPAMYRSLNRLGSVVLDVHANRIEQKFIRENGTIDDYYTLIKGPAQVRMEATTEGTNGLTLQWNSIADRDYHVEQRAEISATIWTNVSGTLRASNSTTAWSTNRDTDASFFRVKDHGN